MVKYGCDNGGAMLLLIVQLGFFCVGEIADILAFEVDGISTYVTQGVATGFYVFAIFLTLVRRFACYSDQPCFAIFIQNQLKFSIVYSLTVLTIFLIFNVFQCKNNSEDFTTQIGTTKGECLLSSFSILFRNFLLSLSVDNGVHIAEITVYLLMLFVVVVQNGGLMLYLLGNLEGNDKDLAVLYISIVMAYNTAIMDIMYRNTVGGFDREKDQERLNGRLKDIEENIEKEVLKKEGKNQVNETDKNILREELK